MHPGRKKADEPQQAVSHEETRPSLNLGTGTQRSRAPEEFHEQMPAGAEAAVAGEDPQERKPVAADKFAYLRAQVQVFRRSH